MKAMVRLLIWDWSTLKHAAAAFRRIKKIEDQEYRVHISQEESRFYENDHVDHPIVCIQIHKNNQVEKQQTKYKAH